MANKKEVEIAGGIRFGLTEELRKIFNTYPTIKVIHLNSYGGRVAEARLLKEFIEEKGLSTSTNKGCLSACTIAYMGGVSRFIYGEKKLGFHRYGLADNQTDFNKKVVFESFIEDRALFLKKGASNKFLGRVFKTSPSDIWLPGNDVLLANHIVTDIAENAEFLLYRETATIIKNGVKKISGDIPAYPAVKEYEPQEYKKSI